MMSRLFLLALLAVLGVVSGFAPVANTASVVGEFPVHADAGEENDNREGTELMEETVRPSFTERERERERES